ncbi:MAG: NAD(P)/FAD-dependent oxidoreductase [Clostridia bacterium]|nr:NAD(P)/FAD-dependent oxidoreductase [Clostridia bacterium]
MAKVVVIGGGAAGLMAAGTALQNGADVTVIEKNEKPGRKLMITGKGRCNVTNNCPDIAELIKNVPTNGRFLYSAFSAFMPQDTMALFENLGVPLKTERGNRVFPVSDKAADIVDALKRYSQKADFVQGRVVRLEVAESRILSCVLEDGRTVSGDAFILATGGVSYPLTGSTGDGFKFAKMLGHRVTELKPSLVALRSPNGFCPKLQGLTLKNVRLTLYQEGKKKSLYTELGEMLFTHFGISGPMVLSASAYIKSFENASYFVTVDWKPGLTAEQLDARICRDFTAFANKDFVNALGKLLPQKCIPVMVSLCGIDPHKKVNQITKEERRALVRLLKEFRIDVTAFWSIEQAVITSGGVSTKEIDPKSMCSKLYENLYFAGEMIDVDAFTGGFNLQIAFSTAYAAATHASQIGGE